MSIVNDVVWAFFGEARQRANEAKNILAEYRGALHAIAELTPDDGRRAHVVALAKRVGLVCGEWDALYWETQLIRNNLEKP